MVRRQLKIAVSVRELSSNNGRRYPGPRVMALVKKHEQMSRGSGCAKAELDTGGLNRGFTLVELLVVIGILAVLVAVLVPALRGARKSAKKAVCGTHLHQMGIATEVYYNEYGCYPPHKWKMPDGTNDRWPSAVAEYLRSEKLQICPSVPR